MSRKQGEPRLCKNCGKSTIRDYGHDYNVWVDDGIIPEPSVWQCVNCGILMSKNKLGGIQLGRVAPILLAPGEFSQLVTTATKRAPKGCLEPQK